MPTLCSARTIRILILAAMAVQYAVAQQTPANGSHWVATWASAQQQPRAAGLGRGGPGPGGAGPAAPATAAPATPRPAPPPSAFNNQTVRMIVRTSLGGSRLRVHL